MPHILVQYRDGFADEAAEWQALNWLKRILKVQAADWLSVEERPLSGDDFSIMFLKAGRHDELLEDFQVIILAHAYEARVEDSDGIARRICSVLEDFNANFGLTRGEKTFSVSVLLSEMGYHVSSTTKKEVKGDASRNLS